MDMMHLISTKCPCYVCMYKCVDFGWVGHLLVDQIQALWENVEPAVELSCQY